MNHRGARSAMFTISLALILTLAISTFGAGQARAVVLSIQVSGNTLVDGNGQVVIPHGVNRMGTEYGCIDETGVFDGPSDLPSVQAIKSWTNVNMVRLPLNEDCWLAINGINPAYAGENYKSAIESYVNLLTANGLYVVLDLHWSAPGSMKATGQQPMPDADHSPTFWASVADRFKTNPAVIFDLFNEPFPGCNQDTPASWNTWRNGGTEQLRVAGVCSLVLTYQAAGMQQLIDNVRSTGATNVIMVSGLGWAGLMTQWLTYRPNDPLPVDQIVASHHRYRPPNAWCGDPSCWDTQLAPIAQQVPLITGEIGEQPDDHSPCPHAFIEQYMAWADAHGVGYLAWTWNISPGYCLDLITNYNGTPSPDYGLAYKNHIASLP